MSARPWVRLSTKVITNDELLDLSPQAKVVFLLGLARAAVDCADGVIPTQPRSVTRWTGLDPDEVAPAIEELVQAGFLEVGAGHTAVYTQWDRYQEPQEKFERRQAQNRERVRRHYAKSKLELAQAAAADPTGAEEAPGDLTGQDVQQRVRDWLDEALEAAEPGDRVEVYRLAYDEKVPEAADKYADVSGVGVASLRGTVVAHAATAAGIDVTQAVFCRLQALHSKYGFVVIEHVSEAAAKATNDPLSYLTAWLRRESEGS